MAAVRTQIHFAHYKRRRVRALAPGMSRCAAFAAVLHCCCPCGAAVPPGVRDISVEVEVRAACTPWFDGRVEREGRAVLPARMCLSLTVKAPERARFDILESECANNDWCTMQLFRGSAFAYDGSRTSSWFALRSSLLQHALPPPASEGKYASRSRSYWGESIWSVVRVLSAGGPIGVAAGDRDESGSGAVGLPSGLTTLSGREAAQVRLSRPLSNGAGVTEIVDEEGQVLARGEAEAATGGSGEPSARTVHTEITEGFAPHLVRAVPANPKDPGAGVAASGAKPVQVRTLRCWFDGRAVDTELTRLPEGIWVPKRVTVKDLKGNLRVTAEFSNYRVNSGIPDSFFDLSTLEAQAAKAEAAKKEAGGK